jgi:hypothetical protein
MTGRYAIRLLCIFVLLFAQQAAYTHAAWHAGEQTQHRSKQDATLQDSLCALHGALSQVLGGIHGTPAAAAEACIACCVNEGRCNAPFVALLHSPPARGPPAAP